MRYPPCVYVDTAIRWLKWPAAAASMLFSLPAAAALLDAVCLLCANPPALLLPLVAGAVAYFVVPLLTRECVFQARFHETDVHERTHMLFARLTLHRVLFLQVTDGDGGRTTHRGQGNWLITIAPYCVPILPLQTACLGLLLHGPWRMLSIGVVGFTLASYLVACKVQFHVDQSDLKEVGIPVAAVFCPGALTASIAPVIALLPEKGGPGWFYSRLASHIGALVS